MATAAVQSYGFTPEQLEERRARLGASEVPVVAGYVPFKSRLQLWAEKRGLVPPFEGNEFTEWGNRLEAVIADKYAEVVELQIVKSDTIVRERLPWRSATPDRIVMQGAKPVRGLEIKCRGAFRDTDWGEPGTDQVPADVAIQCHWSMDVTGLKQWDVATLIGGNRFRMYHLYYDAEIAESLTSMGRWFWDFVEKGEEPPVDASAATTAWLQQRFPRNVDDQLREPTQQEVEWFVKLMDVRARVKALEENETELKNLLMSSLGTSAGFMSPFGKLTWKSPNGTLVSWKPVVDELRAAFNLDTNRVAEIVGKHSQPLARRFVPTPPSKNQGKSA